MYFAGELPCECCWWLLLLYVDILIAVGDALNLSDCVRYLSKTMLIGMSSSNLDPAIALWVRHSALFSVRHNPTISCILASVSNLCLCVPFHGLLCCNGEFYLLTRCCLGLAGKRVSMQDCLYWGDLCVHLWVLVSITFIEVGMPAHLGSTIPWVGILNLLRTEKVSWCFCSLCSQLRRLEFTLSAHDALLWWTLTWNHESQ